MGRPVAAPGERSARTNGGAGRARLLLAGLGRLAVLSAVVAAATAVLSLLAGLALGAGLGRALATGFYLAGVFFVIVGVAAGIRGPFRAKGGDDAGRPAALFGIGLGARGVRTASGDERQEAVSTSALFLVLGFVLIILGIAADSTTELA